MRIASLEVAALPAEMAAALARVHNAAAAVDAPQIPPVSAHHVRMRLRYGWDGHPTTHLFVALSGTDEVMGYAELEFPVWDNHHTAFLGLETDPNHRGVGVGEDLLGAAMSSVRSAGRTLLVSEAWSGSHREEFWRRHDFSIASRSAQRRLVVADLDHVRLGQLCDESVAASKEYEIVALPMPAPDELVRGLIDLHLAMNDSPLDDLELEDDVWTEARLRGYEDAMASRRIRLHRLLARRLADGALGGHTVVAVEDERPWLGFQEDTAVVRGHRGHRLGLRLKIEMLRRLATLEPQIELIDTWNAESNCHMLAVNDAIGCVVVGRTVEVQRRLTPS